MSSFFFFPYSFSLFLPLCFVMSMSASGWLMENNIL